MKKDTIFGTLPNKYKEQTGGKFRAFNGSNRKVSFTYLYSDINHAITVTEEHTDVKTEK